MPTPLPEPRPPLPQRLKLLGTLAGNSLYDMRRFWSASFTGGAKGRENLRARIAIGLHFLEYGLSLSGASKGHGGDKAAELAEDLDTYTTAYGPDATTEIALRTLEAWLEVNKGMPIVTTAITCTVGRLVQAERTGLKGGREEVTREEIQARGKMDFLDFAEARHSIRSYSPIPVPTASIERAVRVAQQSPSSCNRQTCRAHVWTEKASIARVLALQSGNRGFGEQLGGVAVITSELAHWENAHERYQAWVDGGMFAMSFAYGMHAEGLGAVMLNWSVEKDRDQELRALIGLSESELVITMIGFGCLPERLNVPVSQRKPLETALRLDCSLKG